MKKLLSSFTEQFLPLIAKVILSLIAICLSWTPVHSQITSSSSSSRCGEGTVVLRATASAGTITWYDVPFYGTAVGTGATFTTPSLPVTKTYYVDALDGSGCSLNANKARATVIATVSAGTIQSNIFYASNTFCKSLSGDMQVTRTGTAGGVFSVSPAGLTLNTTTGAITPSTSTNGTYTITYTITDPAEGCVEAPAQAIITITTAPIAPTIAYSGSPWCSSQSTVSVTQSGVGGGTYSAYPAGLTINANNGTITPATSNTGTYTVTYFVSGAGGCAPQATTAEVTILKLPTAAIFYASPFTQNQTNQLVTLTGTAVYTGGTYSYTGPGTLSLNTTTGTIDPSTSTAGTYTVTYTLPAISPCGSVTTQQTVNIYSLPSASIAGTTSVCKNSSDPLITFTGADGAKPYTFTYQINGAASQTVTTTGINTDVTVAQPTLIAGTHTYTLLSVTDATGSTKPYVTANTAAITVTTPQSAAFAYSGSPYCSDAINPTPTFLDGGIAGTFTASSSDLKFVNAATGEINMATSVAGTYTVTNTLAATGGCGIITATTPVTITKKPVATFSYASLIHCQNAGTNPTPTLGLGAVAGTFTSVPSGVRFSDGNGTVDLANTTPGTYTIVNTIAAANGCADVAATVSNFQVIATPVTPTVTYSGSPFCNTITDAQPVEITGTTGGTFTAGAGLTIAADGAITPSTSTPGTYTVTYTVGTGSCLIAATTSVTISESPVITNSASKTICSNESTNIDITASSSSTFTWTIGTVTGTIDGAEAGSGNRIDQIIYNFSDTNIGTVQYVITPLSTITGCAGLPFTITVTISPKPLVSIVQPAAVCSPSTVDLTAAAITTGSTAGLSFTYWTDFEATNSFSNPATATTGIYYIKGTNANGCSSIRDVQVVVNPLPDAPTAGDITVIYDGANHTGTAIAPSGSTVVWYDAATGGNIVSAPNSTTAGTFTAWAESKADLTPTQCPSATRTLVTVQINKAESTISATGTTSFTYNGAAQGPASSSATGSTGTVSYQYSGTGATTYSASATAPTEAGTYQVVATVAADANYNAKSSDALGFTITKAELTVTDALVTTKTYDGNTDAAITGATLSGIIGADAVTLANASSGTFAQSTPGTGITVTTAPMTLTGAKAGNYNLTQPTLSGQINPAAPIAATHTLSQTSIVWNWSAVSGATGYKWNTSNDYSSANDLGNALTTTQSTLTCNTANTIYVWAYSGSAVSGSTSMNATTSSCVTTPTVATSTATNIGSTSATLNANISATGGATVTARGFKYSETSGFDAATEGTNVPESGSFGTGTFTANISGLSTLTTYYVKAYATNSAGTVYGDQVSFNTLIQTDFTYTGGVQTFRVPAGVTSVTIETYGAQGGAGHSNLVGGKGGYAKGNLSVTPGEVLSLYVGGQGGNANSYSGIGVTVPGGYNGGGIGGYDNSVPGAKGGGGGGASDVRNSGGTRVIIAGGGGGSGYGSIGGDGGGTNGGTAPDFNGAIGGTGGTQSSGGAAYIGRGATAGSLYTGGNGSTNQNAYAGAGGGGGYYGGGGGSSVNNHGNGHNAGGGGGSSYIGGVTSSTTTSDLQSGNGFIKITY